MLRNIPAKCFQTKPDAVLSGRAAGNGGCQTTVHFQVTQGVAVERRIFGMDHDRSPCYCRVAKAGPSALAQHGLPAKHRVLFGVLPASPRSPAGPPQARKTAR